MGYEKKKKKMIQHENSFSYKLHQVIIAAVHSGGILIKCPPVTSRSRRSLLLYVAGNIWLLVCRDTWRFDRSHVPKGLTFDALGTNCIDSS